MTKTVRRCVHVFATFGAGGPQIRALQLMAQMGDGYSHVVMAMDGRTEASQQLPPGIECELAPPPPRAGLVGTVRAQRRWLRAQRPDLVLTYNWGAIESVIAARSLRLPLVHHEDGFLPDEAQRRLARRSWLRWLALRSVPVIVPSSVLQRIAIAEWGLSAQRVHHLPNGVDLERFRSGLRVAGKVLGTVGGMRPEKDHATLLRALATLPDDVGAVLVGGGSLLEPTRQLAAQLGLQGRVEFAGPVADTAPCYHRFAVFVLSSRTEQMPIALLEAMASGLPVVTTDVGDVRLILPKGAADCIVPRENPIALAQALQRVLADRQLQARLGAENRAVVEQHYAGAPCLARYVQIYRQAAGWS